MNRFDAVLFDLDGTLFYTLPDIHSAVNAALAQCGYKANTLDDTRTYVGYGSRWLIEKSLPEGTPRSEADRVLIAYRAYYNDHLMVDTVPYPGIAEMLTALRERGVALGVATNKFHDSAVRMMARYFPGFFGSVQGNIEGRPTKPAPDAALAAMEELGAARDRTLFVGDSGPDALTAANAGMSCVLCDWGYRTREELESYEGPLAVISRPEELLRYI